MAEYWDTVLHFWDTSENTDLQSSSKDGKHSHLVFIHRHYSWLENHLYSTFSSSFLLLCFMSSIDNNIVLFCYRSLESETGSVFIWGEKTWRDSEDVLCNFWLQHDQQKHPLDTTETRQSSGVDWLDEYWKKLCQLCQFFSRSFLHDWKCAQQHSVPGDQESDSRRRCCLLLCTTDTVTEGSGGAEQKPPHNKHHCDICVFTV